MRIPRIYTAQALASQQSVELESQASIHLSRALRLQEGHPVIVFNGQGGEYSGEITSISKKHVKVQLNDFHDANKASPVPTEICIAVSKGDKVDLIVQKCTELGVTRISPVITERSDVKLNPERWAKKQQQWQHIAISACEQSGRNTVPEVQEVKKFHEWVQSPAYTQTYMLHPGGDLTIQSALTNSIEPTQGFSFCFGSEGGFSEQEAEAAQAKGVNIIGLGPRVLRAETAPIAVMAIVQTLCGDF